MRRLESVPHRLELSKRVGMTLIDDSYNSNPSGTKAALETLSFFEGEKILVTPGMVELGDKQEEYNCEFGRNAAAVCDYVALVGERQTKGNIKVLSRRALTNLVYSSLLRSAMRLQRSAR